MSEQGLGEAPAFDEEMDVEAVEVGEIVEDEEEEEEQEEEELDEEAAAGEERHVHEVPPEFAEIARKYKAHEELSDDDLDKIADAAIEILRTMLSFFDADDADIDEYDDDDGGLVLDVSNADLAILIGRHGKTLEAFQYLFSVLVNARLGFRYPVIVDIEGYRARRREKIEGMARSAASRALQRGVEVRMHPMKPYERRLVHLALRDVEGVTTHSEGTEPNRCVIVAPAQGQGRQQSKRR